MRNNFEPDTVPGSVKLTRKHTPYISSDFLFLLIVFVYSSKTAFQSFKAIVDYEK